MKIIVWDFKKEKYEGCVDRQVRSCRGVWTPRQAARDLFEPKFALPAPYTAYILTRGWFGGVMVTGVMARA